MHKAQRVTYPEPGKNTLQFTKTECQLRLPFVLYCDFESILENVHHTEPRKTCSWTEKYEKHTACSFCIYTVSTDKRFYSKPISYFGEDAGERFLDTVMEEIAKIRFFLENKVEMDPLSDDEIEQYNNSTHCHILPIQLRMTR